MYYLDTQLFNCIIVLTVLFLVGPSLADRNGSMETAHSSSPDVSHEGSGGSLGGGGVGVATLGIPGALNPGGGFDINDFFKFADTITVSCIKVMISKNHQRRYFKSVPNTKSASICSK